MLVMKFGGTSVGSGAAIRDTARLIADVRQQQGPVVVVASAMGSRPVKVTDMLLQGARAANEADGAGAHAETAAALRHVHGQAIADLLPPGADRDALHAEIEHFVTRYEALCAAVSVLGELTPRALDAIGGMGEQMSVRLLAAYLREMGLAAEAFDATELIRTDSNFQAAAPDMDETRTLVVGRLRPLLDAGVIPVVTGFIGADAHGVTTTLGRGGSDFSAAILGQALYAGEVWIWTDVDGVMSADPRLTPGARSIPELSYREVAELAYYGARVLHPKTIRPCIESAIPLRIKNTFNPAHPGTVIVADSAAEDGGIKAVTAITKLSLVTVEGRGMIGVQGIAARTFGAVARNQASVLLISQASSEQSICFAIADEATDRVVAGLEAEFAAELGRRDIDRVWAHRLIAIVTAVGAGMRHTPGVAGRIFGALGRAGINVIAIAQGSSECSISLVVAGEDVPAAIAEVHQLIVG